MKNDDYEERLKKFLDKRDALFRNPTAEAALKYWQEQRFSPPLEPSVPLASVHKARLQWLEATDAMLAESVKWLQDSDYHETLKGAPPLTPETRDAQRVMLGKKPLGEMKNDDE